MGRKRVVSVLLTCMLLFSCTLIPAIAVEAPNDSIVMPRVSGRLNYTFAAGATTRVGQSFSLAKGDIISYDCTYMPKSASLDFGLLDSDNVFHYLNCTSGSFSKSIKVDAPGQYILAIRNNEDYAVTVTGTVRY